MHNGKSAERPLYVLVTFKTGPASSHAKVKSVSLLCRVGAGDHACTHVSDDYLSLKLDSTSAYEPTYVAISPRACIKHCPVHNA